MCILPMYFVFDTETSGLPVFTRTRGYHNPKDYGMYASSRIVSISWIVTDANMDVQSKETHIIRPDGFEIGKESIAIHGITNEIAHEKGKCIKIVLQRLVDTIGSCKTLVAHNIHFDVNILRAECHRYGFVDLAKDIGGKERYCTMARGKEVLRYHKNPKLSELYTLLCGEEITNAHDAEFDTWHCYKCFAELQKREDKKRKRDCLSDEQLRVVKAPVSKSMLVLAGAGSGKTMTIVHRIKDLVDQGVLESSIVLTTFTKDAANEMDARLQAVFGYKPAVVVGTFDSLSLRFLKKYAPDVVEYANVGEYAPEFLKLLNGPTSTSRVFLKEITHMFVDEFQDINQVQFDIIDTFYRNDAHITAIGDDAQNIFAFRGSDIRFISNFSSHFRDAETYVLSTNFRSSKQIIDVANAVISCDKTLIQKRMHAADEGVADGIRPSISFCENHATQCALVCDKIKEYCRNGYKPSDIAVLCPQNQFLFGVEELLTARGVPNVLLDGRSDVRSRPKPDHVCLSTIHKAKGLEWDVVFLIMMNDEVLPVRKDEESVCEGRRLFYVGVTRPRKLLHMYFSPVYACSSVTRYISELDYNALLEIANCKSTHFLRSTRDRSFKASRQLKSILRNLSNEQLAKIRQLMPGVTKKSERVHGPWEYPEFVATEDMYEEYDNFLRILVQKMASEAHDGTTNALAHPSTAKVTSGIVLDYTEATRYNKYKMNFKDNLVDISKALQSPDDIFSNRGKILSMFMNGSRVTLQGQDVSIILGILYKMKKSADKNGIRIHNVSILNEMNLPDDMRRRLATSYAAFKHPSRTMIDVVPDIWQISKCDRFVEDNRKRMFYKHVPRETLLANVDHFQDIMDGFVKRWLNRSDKVDFHIDVDDNNGLQGRAFAVLANDKKEKGILTIKASADDITKPDLVIECICLKAMMGAAGLAVRSATIYNPVQGTVTSYDISTVDARGVLATVSGA